MINVQRLTFIEDVSLSDYQLRTSIKNDYKTQDLVIQELPTLESMGNRDYADRFTFKDRNTIGNFSSSEASIQQYLPISELKAMAIQIAEYSDQHFDELPDQYINELVEFATVVNYRLKSLNIIKYDEF